MRAIAAVLILTLCACAGPGNTLLKESDRVALQQYYASQPRYLKVSCYVTPFFQDQSAWLLIDRSPDENTFEAPEKVVLEPGEPVGILPVGTLLRVERISWPTGLAMAGRSAATPRDSPWIYLRPAETNTAAARLAAGKPFILVLRSDMRSRDEALTEIGLFLTSQNPAPELRNLSVAIVDAVEHKKLRQGMAPEQVQQAWGYPERMHIDTPKRTQLWTWPGGTQQAWFQEEILVRWEDHGKQGGG